MFTRIQKLAVLCLFFVMALMLASCGGSGIGAIPSGTPDHGNGTPAVIPTPASSRQAVATAPASELRASYAFARKDQLWVARDGAKPVPLTYFDDANAPDVIRPVPSW